MDNKNIQSYDSNAKKRVFEGIKIPMHQDLRESITKRIMMRPSRETDYPASVGVSCTFHQSICCWLLLDTVYKA